MIFVRITVFSLTIEEDEKMSKNKVALLAIMSSEDWNTGDKFARTPHYINDREVVLVVVDTCSSEKNREIAEAFTPHFKSLPLNSGAGAAIRVGIQYIAEMSGCDHVILFDADGQYDFDRFARVDEVLNSHDIVTYSRFHPHTDQTYTPIDQILINTLFIETMRKITNWELTDVRSDFMGFHLQDLRAIASDIIGPRNGVCMELLLRLWEKNPNASIHEIPYLWPYGTISANGGNARQRPAFTKDRLDTVQFIYEAFLLIVNNLGISRDKILKMKRFTSG